MWLADDDVPSDVRAQDLVNSFTPCDQNDLNSDDFESLKLFLAVEHFGFETQKCCELIK